jgi:hydrogenase maturation protease
MSRVLVACIGNIFLGDDAFGPEVARALQGCALPPEVLVKDFGIRGFDLACALEEPLEAVILVDATPRGEAPGTLYLIEPDLAQTGAGEETNLDGHSLDPVRVLQLANKLEIKPPRLFLVGCEPTPIEAADDLIGLSPAVQNAVPKAVTLIESLAVRLLNSEAIETGLVLA